MILLRRF